MEEGQGDPQQNDFSEYMWMEDLEKFDKEMTSKIAEEDYIRSSIEMLLEEEERETHYFDESGHEYVQNHQEQFFNGPNSTNGIHPPMQYYGPMGNNASLNHAMENLGLSQRFPYQQIPPSQFSYPPIHGFPSYANSRVQPESQRNGNNMHYNHNMNYNHDHGIQTTTVSNPTTVSYVIRYTLQCSITIVSSKNAKHGGIHTWLDLFG